MAELGSKKGWTRVAFGDVVDRAVESGVPSLNQSRTYIGLEHLDSGSLSVRRWGSDVPLVVPKTRIRKGDVLFARRNTHLRRCAIAPFDGFFSPDGYAFRSRPSFLLQELLPYVVSTDQFMDYAVEHSAGTHSKRVKWSDLAHYEFDLPPLEEQRRTSLTLRSITAACESFDQAVDALEAVRQSVMARLFAFTTSSDGHGRLEDVTTRVSDGTHQPPEFASSGVPFLLVSNIAGGRIDWTVDKHVGQEVFQGLTRTWRPQLGDVLYSLVGSYGVPAMVDRDIPFTFQRHIGLIRPDAGKLLPRFLYWYLTSPPGRQQAHIRAEGLAQKTITLGALRDFRIPVPALSRQEEIAREIDSIQLAKEALEGRASVLRSVAGNLATIGLSGGVC